jgi:hypothetical protein
VKRAIGRRSQPTYDVVTRREKPLSPAGRIVCTLVIKDDPPEASGKGRIGACDQKRPARCSPRFIAQEVLIRPLGENGQKAGPG